MTKEERAALIDYLYEDISQKEYEDQQHYEDRLMAFDDNAYEVLCPYENYKILSKKIISFCVEIQKSRYIDVLLMNKCIKCCMSLIGLIQYDMNFLKEKDRTDLLFYRLNTHTFEFLYPVFALLLPISIKYGENYLKSAIANDSAIGIGDYFFEHQDIKSYIADGCDGDVDMLQEYESAINNYNSIAKLIETFFLATAEMLTREIDHAFMYFMRLESIKIIDVINSNLTDESFNNERTILDIKGLKGYNQLLSNLLYSNKYGKEWLVKYKRGEKPNISENDIMDCLITGSISSNNKKSSIADISKFNWGNNEDLKMFTKYLSYLLLCWKEMHPPKKVTNNRESIFDSEKAKIYWEKLAKEGFTDENGNFTGNGINEAAYIAIRFNEVLRNNKTSKEWKYFEVKWNMTNLRNTDCAKGNNFPKRSNEIDRIFD